MNVELAPKNLRWKNKWALVTGATSGIGRALAEELASAGVNLILTGRRLQRLEAAAEELNSRYGIQALFFQADLALPSSPQAIWEFTESCQIQIELLVNNAGLLEYGDFVTSEVDKQLAMLQVHCIATTHLCRLYLPGMVHRNSGDVLIVATTTLIPAPYLSIYAASKGFLLLFAEGIREEVGRHGVNVSILCAGPTESELHANAQVSSGKKSVVLQSAREVAQRALAGVIARNARIYPSLLAKVAAVVPRLLPRSTVSGAAEKVYRPVISR